MKAFIKLLLILSCVLANAQVAPLFNYQWSLEKVVIDEEEIMAELDFYGDEVGVFFDEFNFIFDDFVADVTYDNSNQSFVVDNYTLTLGGSHQSDAADAVKVPFLLTSLQPNEVLHNPFNYDFRDEDDTIYLDITNSEGDVATFWASTLSSSKFEESDFSIYPNPVTNQLYIKSQQPIHQVEIFNLSGKRILNEAYQENQPVNVSSLAKDLYVLKIETETGIFTKKLVKE